MCGFGDVKGTFGGTSERKLPFEAKKESVMNIQNWVKIDSVDQPSLGTNGYDIGIVIYSIFIAIKYLKLRSENRDKAIAMTLANKISCKDNTQKMSTRSDGYQVLYKSQMKNNDKEFKMVVDRLKKNIPEHESKKYALRRMQSDNLFKVYHKKPIVQPSEMLYIDDIDIPDDMTDVGKVVLKRRPNRSSSAQQVISLS